MSRVYFATKCRLRLYDHTVHHSFHKSIVAALTRYEASNITSKRTEKPKNGKNRRKYE